MSILLIDVGNTRIKWARLEKDRLNPQRAAAHAGWQAQDFARHLFKGTRDVERVVVASVASTRVDRALAVAARQRLGFKPQFVKTQRRLAGVRTRYREPWHLGVDRLVAAIGAHCLARGRAVCVVDIGTAMTIDLVDAQGVHLGGAIVPGPQLMVDSLLKDTTGIARRARSGRRGRSLFARDTRAAVEQGARYAIAAVVDRAIGEAARVVKQRPLLLLTGGAAESVRALVAVRSRLVPNLVLRGLAAIVSQPDNPFP